MSEFEREDYDELKAYKIISNMYETQKKELNHLEKKLKDNHLKIEKLDENIKIANEKEDKESQIFLPNKSNELFKNEVKKLENRKKDIEKHNDFIHQRIIKTRELVAEYSFVMNILKNKSKETENQIHANQDFLNDMTDKLIFCKEIVMLDPMRVSDELDTLCKTLQQLK